MESHFPISPAHQSHLARERVIDDVRALVADGELLLQSTADDLGQKALAARRRLVAVIRRAQFFLVACEERADLSVRSAVARTEARIVQNPFTVLTAGVGFGFCLGLWAGARSRRRE